MSNEHRLTGGGQSIERLAARIKRDHPEIAARVEAGEFKSIRAAAIEAGIIKVSTDFEKAKKAVEKLPHDQLVALVAEMMVRIRSE